MALPRSWQASLGLVPWMEGVLTSDISPCASELDHTMDYTSRRRVNVMSVVTIMRTINSTQLGFIKPGFKGPLCGSGKICYKKTTWDPGGLWWEQPCLLGLLNFACVVTLPPASLICLSDYEKNCQGLSESVSIVREDPVMQRVRSPCHSETEGATTKLLNLLRTDQLIIVWGWHTWPGRLHVCLHMPCPGEGKAQSRK